jgi:predicted MFS family arabinose efflux permease
MVMAAAGLYLLATAYSLQALLLAGVLYGLGFGAVNPALMALTVDRARLAGRGAAMATFSAAFDLGIGLGSVLLGYVLQLTSFAVMYLTGAAIVVLGSLAFAVGQSHVRKDSPT